VRNLKMKKFCPLKFNWKTLDKDGNPFHLNACLCEEKECAWWEENRGTCAVKTIAHLKGRDVYVSEIGR
jgi:hypothetical protein